MGLIVVRLAVKRGVFYLVDKTYTFVDKNMTFVDVDLWQSNYVLYL